MPRQQLGNSQLQHSKRAISRNNSGAQSRNRAASAKRNTLIVNGAPDHSVKNQLDKDNEKTRAGLRETTGYGAITDALQADRRGSLRPSNERRIVSRGDTTNDVRNTQAQLDSMLSSLVIDPNLPIEQRFSFLRFTYDNDPVFKEFINDFASENGVSVTGSLSHAAARIHGELNNESPKTYGLPSVSEKSKNASLYRASTAVDKKDMINLVQRYRESATEPEFIFPDFLKQWSPEKLLEGFRRYDPADNSLDNIKSVDNWVRELVGEALANQQKGKNNEERLVTRFYEYLRNPNIRNELEQRVQSLRASSVDGFRVLSPDDVKPGDQETRSPRDARRRSVSVNEANLFADQIRGNVDNVAANVDQVRETLEATAGDLHSRLKYIEDYLIKVGPYLDNLNQANVTDLRSDLDSLATQVQESLGVFQNLGTFVNNSLGRLQGQYIELDDDSKALQQKFDGLRILTNNLSGEIRDYLKQSVGSLNDRDKDYKKKLEEIANALDEKLANAIEDQSNRLDGLGEEVSNLRERQSALSDRVRNLPSSSPRGGSGPPRPPSPNSTLPGLSGGPGNGNPPRKGGGEGGNGFADPGSSRKEIAQADPKGMVSSSPAEEKLGKLFPQLYLDSNQLNRYYTTKLAYLWRSTKGDEKQIRDALSGAVRVGDETTGNYDPVYDTPGELISSLKDLKLDNVEVYARHADSLRDLQTAHHTLLTKVRILEDQTRRNLEDTITRLDQVLKNDDTDKLKNLKESLKYAQGTGVERFLTPLKDFVSAETGQELTEKEQDALSLANEFVGFKKDQESLKNKRNHLKSSLNRFKQEEAGLLDVIKNENLDISHPAKQVDSLKKNVADILDAIQTKKKNDEDERKALKQELINHRSDVEKLVKSLWVKEPIERIAAVSGRIQKAVSGSRPREVAVPRPTAPREPARKRSGTKKSTTTKKKEKDTASVTDADAVWKRIMQNQRWKG